MQIVVFLAAFLTSLAFTRFVRDFSVKRGWVSAPASDRHIHSRPVPRLGGIAVFLTLWCIALLALWLPVYFGTPEFPFSLLTLRILGPVTIFFFLGLIDSISCVSSYKK